MDVDEDFIELMEEYRLPDKSVGLIEACSKNVNVFSEYMLGLRPYAWQTYFMHQIQDAVDGKDDEREYVALTSRQIGKSTSLAILALWMTIFNKYPGTLSYNTVFGIISASDTQAKKLLYEMKKLIRIGDRYLERNYKDDNGEPMFGKTFFSDLLDENEPNNTTTITLKPYKKEIHGDILLKDSYSGSVIKSYPPTSAVLGETFTVVVVDEAGKTDKITDQFFYDFLYPTGNSTNAIRIYTSTPWVSSGFFYRTVNPDNTYNDVSAKICVFTVDAIRLENPKYYDTVMKTVKELNADGKTDEVQRAYYCRFVKGESAYFKPDKVLDMFSQEYQQYDGFRGQCDMGVDFGGQTTSKTVITISALTKDNKVKRLFRQSYDVGEDNSLVNDIADLLERFNIQRIIPDDCPQGDYLIREMEEKGWNVHPMNFKSEKIKKYGAFRGALNRGEIESFEDDELKTEMLALEVTEGVRQSKIKHAPGYSDDLIDSFVMSTYFYVQEEGGLKVFDYDSIEDISDVCPNCKGSNLFRKDMGKYIKLHCKSCGYTWNDKSDSIYD